MDRLAIVIASFMLLSVSLAQLDLGVDVEIDEFTGARSCSQLIVDSAVDQTGLFARITEDLLIIGITRGRAERSVFNMFGVMPGDLVYIRWPDGTVREFTPAQSEYSFELNYEVAILLEPGLVFDLMSSPGDLRIRFRGSSGSEDFTIPHSTVVALATGFGAECLD